jgi:hypothetical protein
MKGEDHDPRLAPLILRVGMKPPLKLRGGEEELLCIFFLDDYHKPKQSVDLHCYNIMSYI